MNETKNNAEWSGPDYPERGSTERLEELVSKLIISEERNQALLELSKTRNLYEDLAPVLWYSFGSIAALLQEIVSIYPLLSPPTLTTPDSDRICNALALLQQIAKHHETQKLFLDAQIPLFLYPFLNTVAKSEPFDFLRLTSLGVIGALVKVDDPTVINFLLQTEIIPLCLRIMEIGCELSKTVATFIVYKILSDDQGLQYICATPDRFYAILTVLTSMVTGLTNKFSVRVLKHVYRCFVRLCDNHRAKVALKSCTPEELKDDTFLEGMKQDLSIFDFRNQLLKCLSEPSPNDLNSGVGSSQIAGGSSTYSLVSSSKPGNFSNIGNQNYQQMLRHNQTQ